MWHSPGKDYSALKSMNEDEDEDDGGGGVEGFPEPKTQQTDAHSSVSTRTASLVFASLSLLTTALLLFAWHRAQPLFWSPPSTVPRCTRPALRREWRALNTTEKHSYLSAVTCLLHTPSRLNTSFSRYDDYYRTHNEISVYAHSAAPFVAWHRYFIHLLEFDLRHDCGYQGSLPYWDWTLDGWHLSSAPVWDSDHGFGGASHPISPATLELAIGGDRCVVDGPFAEMPVHWKSKNGTETVHCLSRAFTDPPRLDDLGYKVKPEKVAAVLELEQFDDFFLQLEDGPHNAIPRGTGGDFAFFTAPADPVFFLHHSPVDRLWWGWQQMHPGKWREYRGTSERGSVVPASTDDMLEVGGLAVDLPVKDILDTEAGSALL